MLNIVFCTFHAIKETHFPTIFSGSFWFKLGRCLSALRRLFQRRIIYFLRFKSKEFLGNKQKKSSILLHMVPFIHHKSNLVEFVVVNLLPGTSELVARLAVVKLVQGDNPLVAFVVGNKDGLCELIPKIQ